MSWVADWASHWTGTFPVGPLYVLVQTALIVWAVAPHQVAAYFISLLCGITASTYLTRPADQPDILVHSVAWLGLLTFCWRSRFRVPLRLAFGLGLLAWWGYVLEPGWTSWLSYQSIRFIGIGSFCWVARADA